MSDNSCEVKKNCDNVVIMIILISYWNIINGFMNCVRDYFFNFFIRAGP